MSSRPVLSMQFYDCNNKAFVNPYQEMIETAVRQKTEREQLKKKTINETMTHLNEAITNFFPKQAKKGELEEVKQTHENKHSKQYFSDLDSNLRLINSYLQILQKQV